MQKRGSSQVDWAISLAIFLLYIAWFFILAKPQLDDNSDVDTLAAVVSNNFLDNVSWTVKKTPIFIEATETGANQPLIIDDDWDNFTFLPEKYYSIQNDKIYLLSRVDKLSFPIWVVSSNSHYDLPDLSKDIEVGENFSRVAEKGFDLRINQGLPESISRNNIKLLKSYKVYSNGELLSGNSTFSSSKVHGIHTLTSDVLTHNTLVFAESPRAFLIFNMNTELSQSVLIEMEVHAFSDYYITSDKQGSLDNLTGCISKTYKQIELHDLTRGLAFTSNRDLLIQLCAPNSSTVLLNFSTDTTEDFEIVVSTHLGISEYQAWKSLQQANTEMVPYYARPNNSNAGVATKLVGIKEEFLDDFSNLHYNDVKLLWGFPQSSDFAITITNSSTSLFNYTERLPQETDTVIAKQELVNTLDKFGNLKSYVMSVKVW